MFLPSLRKLRASNAIVFQHPCRDCGDPHASFGRGVNLMLVHRKLAKGEKVNRAWLGEWTCGPNGCRKQGAVA